MNPSSFNQKRRDGSALLCALGVITVSSVIVGVAISNVGHRYQTAHHSLRWKQASDAAEAGAEIAFLSGSKETWVADGWSAAPGAPGAAPVTKNINLAAGVPGAGVVTVTVSVDTVTMNGTNWLRIRSTGVAEIYGKESAGVDNRDNLLRKLSLRSDRGSGTNVSTPRATRTIMVLGEPLASNPFKYTFVSKQLFDIHTNTTSDSYDSSDAAKSNFTPFTTYGIYDAAKRQQNGDVGTLDTAQWNFNQAHIWGDVLAPAGNVANATNIHGTVQSGFTFNFPTEVSPNWATVTQNHGAVTNVSKTFAGGTQASPTKHKFASLNLSADDKNVRITNPVGKTESWIEGDTLIDGKNQTGIKIDPGVHATIYFGSKVEIKGGGGGYALSNDSKLPENLILRAYGGSSGATKDFSIAYTDFWGVVSAPWYKVKFDMNGKHVHGSFMSWQFDCSDGTNLHYDEALGRLAYGAGKGYKMRSWIETVR